MVRRVLLDKAQQRTMGFERKSSLLIVLVLVLFGAIGGRLFWLQVLQGSFYRKLSDENRIRLIASAPMRGRILDRNGKLLAGSKLSYTLSVQPRLVTRQRWPVLRDELADLLELSKNSLQRAFLKGIRTNPYRIILVKELTSKQVLRFKENESIFIGAQLDEELFRHYPFESMASHVLGYTQLVTEKELKILGEKGYSMRDRIGRIGVEAAYESHLRGEWGGEMLEVDAIGNIQRSLGVRPPKPGKDLYLTIDLELQKAAEKALLGKAAGAIVVLDPRTGAIRAIASRPTFDPNFFSKAFTTQEEYDRLFLSSQLPLFSRAINAFDPGSTWKPVTAIAGMETGKFPPDVRLSTAPCLKYGSHCFREHNGKGFGIIGYEEALRVSSNTFFYQVGVGVGSKSLHEAATKLGFGALSGIEIGYEESAGLIGEEEWATQGRGWGKPGTTPWIPEDIASASIGQSVIQVTPLQLARAYAAFANGGYLVTPHLSDMDIDWTVKPYRKKIDIQPSTLATVRSGLRKVVQSGTGSRLNQSQSALPPAAGKTGTAEDSTGGSDHAWFACFAPFEDSEIVIVAFAQNTPGGGSVHALPMARQILEVWNRLRSS